MFSAKKIAVVAVVLGGVLALLFSFSHQFRNLVYALSYERTLDRYAQADTTKTDVVNATGPDGRRASIISAFFGLDDAVPPLADWVVCKGAVGTDGLPVIFSHEVDLSTLDPGDFKVTTSSGEARTPICLTLSPADDTGELRTVLLLGPFGKIGDPPATVAVTGNILSLDRSVNLKGLRVAVTPLAAGPSMVLAETVPKSEWALGSSGTRLQFGGGTGCPSGTKQIIRVVWDGGITKPGGAEVDDSERRLYKVAVLRSDQTIEEITPFALGDLNDGDNNHKLCLRTTDAVKSVSFPAGHVTDPRDDLNPATSISLARD